MSLNVIILGLCVTMSGGTPVLDDETFLLQSKLLVGKSGLEEFEKSNQSVAVSINISKSKSRELEMAEIAGGIYLLEQSINGWELIVGANLSTQRDSDYFGVYSKGRECVVAFAGSNSMDDFFNNFDAFNATSYCGLNNEIHSGFITELEGCRRSPKWPEVEQALSDTNLCGDGIISVGHSLGAALSEIFAACVNSNPQYYTTYMPNRPVDAIYSFAGPGTTKVQLTNGQSTDGCFAGSRFYNLDYWSGDSVPKLAYPLGFVHPKLKAVDLDCRREWFSLPGQCTMHTIEYACDSEDARGRPWTVSTPLPSMHYMATYIDRIQQYFG